MKAVRAVLACAALLLADCNGFQPDLPIAAAANDGGIRLASRCCRPPSSRAQESALPSGWTGPYVPSRPCRSSKRWMNTDDSADGSDGEGSTTDAERQEPQKYNARPSAEASSVSPSASAHPVRFLGRGPHAIVRPGVVLVSPTEEFDHFLRKSAIFIYGMGYDEHDVYVIRGVILDHPTPFTVSEMISQTETASVDSHAPYSQSVQHVMDNLVFRGGRIGNDASIAMFHSDEDLAKADGSSMIGTSGVYQGGFATLLQQSSERNSGDDDSSRSPGYDPSSFKFFFNYVEFTEEELEAMLIGDEDDGDDKWISLEVPQSMILDSSYDRGDAWKIFRNMAR